MCVEQKITLWRSKSRGKRRVEQQRVKNEEARGEFLARRLQNLRRAVRAEGGGVARVGPSSIGRAVARELREKDGV